MTYVGKSTLGDLTKTAKEAAAKKGLMKTDASQQAQQIQASQQQFQSQHQPGNSLVSHGGGLIAGTGRDFFSSFSSEINGITSSTSSMFSGLFGKSTCERLKM